MGLLDRIRQFRRPGGRRHTSVMVDDHAIAGIPGSGVAVYETDGRLVLRVVDGSDGLGIERDENHVVVGLDELDPRSLGELVVSLAGQAQELVRPTSWPKLSEYAAPLIASAPTRHRSYRSWQRATRYVSVSLVGQVGCTRLHADLSHGSWIPAGGEASAFPQRIELGSSTTSDEIGSAVMQLLVEPPIAG
jgi:hypothetical protein